MKITVKKDVAVAAVKKLSAGVGKETPIIITVVRMKEGYVGSFRVDGDVQVFTRFACEVDAEGEVQMVVPTMFVTAFNSLARLGDEVTFEFTDSGVELTCGAGKLTVPKLAQDAPAQASLGNPVGSVAILSAQLKEALSVRNFIIPVKDCFSWINCVGMKIANGGIRFVGACNYELMVCDEVTEVKGLVGSSLAVPVLLLNKVTALLDGESVAMHVFGREQETGKEVTAEDGSVTMERKLVPTHLSVVDANTVYMLPLCAVPYGNIDAVIGAMVPLTRFSATLKQRDLVNAISIILATGSEVFTIDMVDGRLRVADDAGVNYVDIESTYTGEFVKTKFACSAVMNGIASMGNEIVIKSNSSASSMYADRFLFVSPSVEDVEANMFAAFAPIGTEAEARAQAAQIKQKAAVEKAVAEESVAFDAE